MLVIKLNPHFKNMKVIWDFVGHAHVILNVIEYDINIVCPLYVFFHLNHVREVVESTIVEDNDFFLGRLYQMMIQSCPH
jgi:hypothetical protein